MKQKLVVLDIDGTLLTPEKKLTANTKMTLLKVQQLGIKLVLATGRPTHGVLSLVRELEMDKNGGYILSYNGSEIIETETNERLFEKKIDPEFIGFLNKKAKKEDFAIFTYHDDQIITDSPENNHIIEEAALNDMKIKGVNNFVEAIDFEPHKVMLVSDDQVSLCEVERRLTRRLTGSLDLFPSETFFLEVVPQFINKGNTLSLLMQKLEIATEEVMVIGDGVCDVTMLQLAGLGIAMGNAQTSVKACADDVTSSNEEEGVAKALQKYVLADIPPSKVPLDKLNETGRYALMGNLGIQYTYASEQRIEATMPVDQRTRQPFGILHGGATLALAETVAGLGSLINCAPDEIAVGMQVSGNHVSSAHEGDTVRAVGTIIHKGRSSHVWNVDIFTSTDKLVSSIRVINSLMKKR